VGSNPAGRANKSAVYVLGGQRAIAGGNAGATTRGVAMGKRKGTKRGKRKPIAKQTAAVRIAKETTKASQPSLSTASLARTATFLRCLPSASHEYVDQGSSTSISSGHIAQYTWSNVAGTSNGTVAQLTESNSAWRYWTPISLLTRRSKEAPLRQGFLILGPWSFARRRRSPALRHRRSTRAADRFGIPSPATIPNPIARRVEIYVEPVRAN
jgi:hypothetical protein